MVLYKCFRCCYECNQKSHLLNHLSRKKQCISKLNEINNIDILKLNKIEEYNKIKYDVSQMSAICQPNVSQMSAKCKPNVSHILVGFESLNNKKYKCKYCNNEYKHRQSKSKHERKCENKLKVNEEIINKDNQIKELIETVNKLSKGNNTLIKGNNNNNNNITNNIVINNFENENIDYFNEKIVMKLVSNFNYMTGKFVELLHFNEKHPENHTIRIKDIKSGLGEIKEENNWKYLDINNFLDLVLRNLQDKLHFMRDKISEKNISKFEDLYDLIAEILEDKRKLKNVKKDIKIASINGTNKIN